jgi:hypothetical protein
MSAEEAKTIVSFQAPSRLVERARELASEHDRSLSGELRRALQVHVFLESGPDVEVVASERRGRRAHGPGETGP